MDDVQRMLIERACERLQIEYCHLVDHGSAAGIADLFTDDGVWAAGKRAFEGMDAIRDNFQKRQDNRERRSRHVCSNALIAVQDADNATGTVYLILYRHDDPADAPIRPASLPEVVGAYRDTFRRTDAGWRFSRRDVVADFAS
ncbi:MAG: nuclear transport factor 2 family protein [Minwuia sp.]|nr:nuclear transport factor 2 family protein [Minwuia sp.]